MPAITEATLEMHFHAALMDLFRETYGLGETGSIEFFKYSTQQEKFVGFDQAYVRTELSQDDLFLELSAAASTNGYRLGRTIVGYFLQFKVVRRLVNRSRSMPSNFTTPYYRIDIDSHRKATNFPSQHELLFQLAANPGSMVYYACPMVFDRADLYRPRADLSQLVLSDLVSAPGAYQDNERHFICFQDPSSQPYWCSEPIAGDSLTANGFVNRLIEVIRDPDLGRQNRNMVADVLKHALVQENQRDERFLEQLSESLTIVSVARGTDAAA